MRLSLALLAWLLAVAGVQAAQIVTIRTPTPVTAIARIGADVFVTTRAARFRLGPCADAPPFCLEPGGPSPAPSRAPQGALPDGAVAEAPAGDIRQAWYADPTDRYSHGVLGDRIEAGSLAIRDAAGALHRLRLGSGHVFEDITPRIADLDGDGANEVVTIRSALDAGAAIAIYGLEDGRLVERAATPEIGTPNRWLNIAAIMPREGGGMVIHAVRTPHIGGTLFSVEWDGRGLHVTDAVATDVSNHVIGSRELGLSWSGELEPGRPAVLVLPSQDRRRLRFALAGHADIRLPGAIDKAIVAQDGWLVTATENGRLLAIRR